jgi:hypothetical protein
LISLISLKKSKDILFMSTDTPPGTPKPAAKPRKGRETKAGPFLYDESVTPRANVQSPALWFFLLLLPILVALYLSITVKPLPEGANPPAPPGMEIQPKEIQPKNRPREGAPR